MRRIRWTLAAALLAVWAFPTASLAWGGLGHRTVAAIAAQLLPPQKLAHLNTVLAQLETDNNFVDAASYPDEFLRTHAPETKSWHFADIPDTGAFTCGICLYSQLPLNLAIVHADKGDKADAVAIAWVIHLVGDLHQPLHMEARERGGNSFAVTYRGSGKCPSFRGGSATVELHSAWDDCLVSELAQGRTPQALASALLGNVRTFRSFPGLAATGPTPWTGWGDASHALAVSVAFDHLAPNADLGDAYIKGPGKGLDTVQKQLLLAGARLAFLLDQAVP